MRGELKLPLLVLCTAFILATADAGAQSRVLETPTPRASLIVDSFDSVSHWKMYASAGVEISIHPDAGRHGGGLRLDFDFHDHTGYALIRRAVILDLPENFEFTFGVRGRAPTNTLEFKLVDVSDVNVWWSNNPYFEFPGEWRSVARQKREICFAWGPVGALAPVRNDPNPPGCRLGVDINRVAAIEFAITAGSGGKGSVWIDDLSLTALDPDSSTGDNAQSRDARSQTYFEFQVERPATMPAGTPNPIYPFELLPSRVAGEVQAQFVVMRSGLVDVDTFRVLKSSNPLFSRAIRNWVTHVTFSPAMLNGAPVAQLVQQSFQFAVPR